MAYSWDYSRKTEPRGSILFDALSPLLEEGEHFLDVDCGYSPMARHILDHSHKITGFDINPKPIQHLKQIHPQGDWIVLEDVDAKFVSYTVLLFLGVTTALYPAYSKTYLKTAERLIDLNKPRLVLVECAKGADQKLYLQVCELLNSHHYFLKKKSHYDAKMIRASKRHYSVWVQP